MQVQVRQPHQACGWDSAWNENVYYRVGYRVGILAAGGAGLKYMGTEYRRSCHQWGSSLRSSCDRLTEGLAVTRSVR